MGWSAELPVPSSAEFCGDCHRAIEEGWKQSAHSQAVESRLFQDAMKLAETDYGASARKTCLSCHSPIAVESGRLGAGQESELGRHHLRLLPLDSGRDAHRSEPKSHRRLFARQERPLERREFARARDGFFAVHTSSLICASCHEYRNSPGVFSSHHLLRVEQERVRRKESKLPVVPHVPSAGERRGPARPKDHPSRHQSP